MRMAFMALFLASVLVVCGCDSESKSSSSSFDYHYSETINGSRCDTKEHGFSDEASFCAALKDEELNGGCARDMRRKQFEFQKCPGSFDPDPSPGPSEEAG